jgi:hypothetical protein
LYANRNKSQLRGVFHSEGSSGHCTNVARQDGKEMKCALVTVVLALSLRVIASPCPDPMLQEATIGGNTVNGGVVLDKKPVKFANVSFYSSSGETAWIGKTDKDGVFNTAQLPPDDYQLEIGGWGSTTIHLNPVIDKGFHQTPVWSILLFDKGCVATIQIMN